MTLYLAASHTEADEPEWNDVLRRQQFALEIYSFNHNVTSTMLTLGSAPLELSSLDPQQMTWSEGFLLHKPASIPELQVFNPAYVLGVWYVGYLSQGSQTQSLPPGVSPHNSRTPTCSPPPTTSTPHDPTHLCRRYHRHLFFSLKGGLSVDKPSSLFAHRHNRMERSGLGLGNGTGNRTGRVNLSRRKQTYVLPGHPQNAYDRTSNHRMTFGPRTAIGSAAAGLHDGERGGSGTRFEQERAGCVDVDVAFSLFRGHKFVFA
ncbi:hypothetical protein DEU56DRAFT_114554 [Suillus clintonianus]|uniref:uncharacterized protein n=1 Tax=Suillus clintonianus TaxID=1904413 RepID=UPI001B867842|nr:uncharacterized protein DEU56DRAFT_114554 [Suillus clintonianus]KAG2120247.1 hypothetical protein DEU56DRAFT_114554 [Suillus clintonianus]